MISVPVFAEPEQQIPQISDLMKNYYQISQQDIPFEDKRYRIFIATPHGKTLKSLPVLYVLDGNAQFPLAVNAISPQKPLPLIVGIGYDTDKAYAIEQRTRDYTPKVEGDEFAKGGSAVDFLRFIQTVLKPYIAKNYDVDEQQQHFFGHSFGGLFGLYTLFHQADLFQYYTIASPSLWWGNGAFVPTQKPWLKTQPKHILVTLGEYEENPLADPSLTEEQLQRINRRKAMRQLNAHQLADELRSQGNDVDFYLISQQNHGGSIPQAIEQAIKFLQDLQ